MSGYYMEYITTAKGVSKLRKDYGNKLYTFQIFDVDYFVTTFIDSFKCNYNVSKYDLSKYKKLVFSLSPEVVRIKLVCYAYITDIIIVVNFAILKLLREM